MNWKAVGIIFIVIAFLAGIGAVVYQITKTTEAYKGKEQTFYSPTYNFAPLSFGCANFRAEGAKTEKINRMQSTNRTK